MRDTQYEMRCGELGLMALCVWREARGESFEAKLAVAFSIMNRVRRPKWWGKNILDVIRKKWQYSSMTDPKDPQLVKYPDGDDPSWDECLEACAVAMDDAAANPAPGADSYYDVSIPAPYWANPDCFVSTIGRLMFYDVDQDYERKEIEA